MTTVDGKGLGVSIIHFCLCCKFGRCNLMKWLGRWSAPYHLWQRGIKPPIRRRFGVTGSGSDKSVDTDPRGFALSISSTSVRTVLNTSQSPDNLTSKGSTQISLDGPYLSLPGMSEVGCMRGVVNKAYLRFSQLLL